MPVRYAAHDAVFSAEEDSASPSVIPVHLVLLVRRVEPCAPDNSSRLRIPHPFDQLGVHVGHVRPHTSLRKATLMATSSHLLLGP